MRDFKNFEVWRRSVILIKNIYQFTDSLPNKEKYNLIRQLERASVSISLNISEGCSRKSDKDFARFIEIALGSANEVENVLLISIALNYTDNKQVEHLFIEIEIIQKMLNSLYGKLTSRANS